MPQESANPALIDATERRGRPSLALAMFIAASVAAHAAVVVLLPGISREPAPAQSGALEVIVMQLEPIPVAETAPEPGAAPKPSAPRRARAKTESRRGGRAAGPVLALTTPEPKAAASPPIAPEVPAESVPPQRPPSPAPDGGAVKPPSIEAAYLSSPVPPYPAASRRAGEQGTVLLRVLVKRDGLPGRVELEQSSGSAHLDAAARDAVRGWRFRPAQRGTDAIESWVVVPVVFRLEGTS